MYWIKGHDGRLVNLSTASEVCCTPPPAMGGTWEVVVYWPAVDEEGRGMHTIVFRGKREECGKVIDDLFKNLREHRDRALDLARILVDERKDAR